MYHLFLVNCNATDIPILVEVHEHVEPSSDKH